MKRVFLLLVLVAAIAAWCAPGFATQTVDPSGTLGATGEAEGVAMIDGAGTLTVDATYNDIFTDNRLVNGISAVDPALVAVSTTAANTDNIVFNSSSTVYGTIGTSGLFFTRIAINDGFTVNFLGTVFTTATAGAFDVGTGAANFNSGTGTNIAAMNFSGNGTISLAPNTAVTGALITGTDDTGTLALGSGSHLTGAVTGIHAINVVGGDNTAGVSATVTGAVAGVHSFSLLTNTLNIAGGALTIASGGIINTTLASPTLYGNIIVAAGNASNLGTGLAVEVTVPSTAYIPVGTSFNIVQSTSGTGAPATVDTVGATNPLYTFSVDTTASAGDATIKTDAIPMQQSPSPVVPVLVDIPNPSDDLIDVLGPINALTDPAAVINAVAQLAPSTPALAAPLVTFQGIRQFQNLWASRLDMCSQEGNQPDANCQGNGPRNGWWVKGFGYYGEQDARGNSTGYDSRIIGTMIAYDAPIGLDTRAGLGFGYARSTIDGDTFDADTDFDTYRALAYIGHERGPWFVNGSASFGWSDYSSMRHIVFPGVNRTANAEYSGQDYTAFASTGFHLSAQKFTVTPIASLQYTRMHIDGYSETGAGDIDLKVKSQDYDFLESGLGVKVERYFSSDDGRTSFVPETHFNWFHELSNPDLEQTAELRTAGSSSFKTSGPETADNLFNVGGGLSLLACSCSATTWSLEAVYDYYWTNEDYSANQLTVRLTSRF
jgi:outer membrane autotransporter protein